MHIVDELEARGLVQDVTDRDGLKDLLSSQVVPFYIGYDPTAPSLHVGHLIPTVLAARLQAAGHKPLLLCGGATGMIGDPSGKSDERQLLGEEVLLANIEGNRVQLSSLVDFDDAVTGAEMVNNADWFAGIGYIEFLRDVGKHLTVNTMIAKDSVKSRLEAREQGISYTEFSYMLLQAFDFVALLRSHGCLLQAGGSDQWGNITAGIELGRKLESRQLYGLTVPLLLDAAGEKMGKTSSGARVWLDPEETSPYAFYQYWLNIPDSDVGRMLRIFSFRPLAEIGELEATHNEAPFKRVGQKTLAEDLTTWVHGKDALDRAIRASQVMFGGTLDDLGDADLAPLLADVPSSEMPRSELEAGVPIIDLFVRSELCKSKGEARRLLSNGGVYVNNVPVADADKTVTTSDLATESMLVLRAGKKRYHIVQVS